MSGTLSSGDVYFSIWLHSHIDEGKSEVMPVTSNNYDISVLSKWDKQLT